jgi:lipopolysaccharide transport system permease protein
MPTFSSKLPENIGYYLNPSGLIRNLWRHRELIFQFTLREIQGRYKGSFLGLFWSFVTPLVLLCTYTFVFGIGFRARWQGMGRGNLAEYALVLFAGITAFNIFSDSALRASNTIIAVPNYVKKVVFPLEVLPLSIVGAALFQAFMSIVVLLAGTLIVIGRIPWTFLLTPFVLLPLFLLTMGATWFLAGFGVFVRDIGYAVNLIVQVLFFLTPIIYPLEMLHDPYRTALKFNPLTSMIEDFRRVMIWGQFPGWRGYAVLCLMSCFFMLLGYAWFMKTKRGFADVL